MKNCLEKKAIAGKIMWMLTNQPLDDAVYKYSQLLYYSRLVEQRIKIQVAVKRPAVLNSKSVQIGCLVLIKVS